jgi:hypothetical protein
MKMRPINKISLYIILVLLFVALIIFMPYFLIVLLFIIIGIFYFRRRKEQSINNGMEYIDAHGYQRNSIKHSNLTHRNVAYYSIYLKHRDKYPLPFRMYQVHHKDHNKLNNNAENLELFTKEEHLAIHNKRYS